MNAAFALVCGEERISALTQADAGAPYVVLVGKKLQSFQDRECGHEALEWLWGVEFKAKVWVCSDCWMIRDIEDPA